MKIISLLLLSLFMFSVFTTTIFQLSDITYESSDSETANVDPKSLSESNSALSLNGGGSNDPPRNNDDPEPPPGCDPDGICLEP